MDIANEIEQALKKSHCLLISMPEMLDPATGQPLTLLEQYGNRAELVQALGEFILRKETMHVSHFHVCITNDLLT